MNKNFRRLVVDTVEKCHNHNFKFVLTPELLNVHSKEDATAGYVCDDEMLFIVSTAEHGWEDVFVHEAAHLDQYIEKNPLWFDQHLQNHDPWDFSDRKDDKLSKRIFQTLLKLEIDCDLRAIEKIKKYKLENILSIDEYIQIANVYHASYYYFWKYKCYFHTDHTPHIKEHLLKEFSSKKIEGYKSSWKERVLLGKYLKKHHISLS
jgi:hypothetical protein